MLGSTGNEVSAEFGDPVLSVAVIVYDPAGVEATVKLQLNVPDELTVATGLEAAHAEPTANSEVGFETTEVMVAP
jgi:hypothetical protein